MNLLITVCSAWKAGGEFQRGRRVGEIFLRRGVIITNPLSTLALSFQASKRRLNPMISRRIVVVVVFAVACDTESQPWPLALKN